MTEKHSIRLPGVLLDEIHSKEGRKFNTGSKKRKGNRKELRKEKRLAKKQKQNHSKLTNGHDNINKTEVQIVKPPVSILSKAKHGKNVSQSPKKTVKFDESLNKVKRVNPAYKKKDFFDERDNLPSDSDDFEEEEDEDDLSDFDDPDQPQTPAEVFEALKNKKLGIKAGQKVKTKSKPQSMPKEKPKTAKEIMDGLKVSKDDGFGDVMSDFSGDSDDMSDLDGPDQPQTAAEVFEALKKAKLGQSSSKKNASKKTAPKTAKEIMEELNGTTKHEENDQSDFSDFSGDDEEYSDLEGPNQPKTPEEVFAALKKAKSGDSNKIKSVAKSKAKTAKEIMEELNGNNNNNNNDESDLSDFSGDSEEISDLEGPDQPQTAEEVFAALKKAKMGKENPGNKGEKFNKDKKESKKLATPSFLMDEMKKDEEDMKYYAKKLGLKGMNMKKADDDDIIGGLFDGLDFMDQYTPGEDGSLSGDENSEEEDEQDARELVEQPTVKENPFVAPVASDDKPKKYVPPALRMKQLDAEDQNKLLIQRSIKGQLNKLSEANILVVGNQINSLYLDNPRRVVSEILTKTVLESIYLQTKLMDSFVVLHSALVAAIYRLQGSEFLGFFIQSLVENFEKFHERNMEDKQKESSNLLSLLSFCYTLQVVNCNLIYDIIRLLVKDLNEFNSELLLRLIRNSGNQLRSDDPLALKEIVSLVYENTKGKKLSPRTEFLIESIEDLKNNKMRKNENSENNYQLNIKMKKFLGTINNNKIHDPLTVSLDDIHDVDKLGKWWLTGSAWKGKGGVATEAKTDTEQDVTFENVNAEAINDVLDSSEPNWNELARAHRMNNDIRRAIFISIMSSDDYIDAFTKLDKLQLKRSQQREIPAILLHCQQLEPGFNKFYGLLAGKLCAEHSFRKTFQFCLWNFIKQLNNEDDSDDEDDGEDVFRSRIKTNLDNEDESEDVKLQKLINSAKIYGFLMGLGSLHLNLFRVVNFLTINEDTRLFLEILFITFFEEVIKKSEPEGAKKSKAEFEVKMLEQRFDKIADPILLKGVQLFLKKNVKSSSFMKKKYQKRTCWAIDYICETKNVDNATDDFI